MLKFIKFFLTVTLLILITLGYFVFWPRYTYEIEGYEYVLLKNNDYEYFVWISPSLQESSTRTYSYRSSPYQISIWIDFKMGNAFNINKFTISKADGIVYISEEVQEQINTGNGNGIRKHYRNIDLVYDDYTLEFEYSIETASGQIKDVLKVPLKREYVKEKVSLWDQWMGI